jgi:ribosome maturation factor RimP
MTTGDAVGRIREVVVPVLEGTPIELLDIRFLTEKGRHILRIYIDKPGGVDLHDCTRVSREVSVLLDVHDLIPKRYTLEVSSPGMDWPLRAPSDFRRNRGRLLKVTVQGSSGGEKTLVGTLIDSGEREIALDVKGKRISLAIADITSARLEPSFSRTGRFPNGL